VAAGAHDGPAPLREPDLFPPGRLSAFHLANGRLFALLDGRALLAFDARTGRILWDHWAASPRSLGVMIRPCYYASGRDVLIQLSSGRLRILNAADGSLRHELASARAPWTADPVATGPRCVVFPEDAEAVTCLDLDTGRRRWTNSIERPVSLAGTLPRLRCREGMVLVGLDRNLGGELDALDAATGRRLWPEALAVGGRAVDPAHIAGDLATLFVPTDAGIMFVSRESGECVGNLAIPEFSRGDWRIIAGKTHLLAFPTAAPTDPTIDLGREFRLAFFNFPTGPRVARLAAKSYDALMTLTFPLLAIDRAGKRVAQRLEFPAGGPAAQVRITKAGPVVVTGAGAWLLAPAKAER
jgi:hypothetical protein